MGKVLCKKCNTLLESKHRHDFQRCECDNETFVDGGKDYLRYGGIDFTYIERIEEEEDENLSS